MSEPGINVRAIPIIGDDLYQVGQVWGVINQECLPSPIIAVKAAFSYAPSLLWALFKPESLDMTFDRVGKRHRTIRKKKWKLADFIQLDPPKKNSPEWYVFRFAEIGQRIGWYFLILDATTDFAVNWSTMAYQWSGCSTANPSTAQTWVQQKFLARTPAGSTVPANFDHWFQAGDCTAGPAGVADPTEGPKNITFTGRFRVQAFGSWYGPVTGVELRVSYGGGPPKIIAMNELEGTPGQSVWQAVDQHLASNFPAASASVWATYGGGDLYIEDAYLTISGANGQGIFPDP